ncbi:MAG TPA: hypothetical protein VMS96_15500 [Terriglobales bacterium]|nr:hypothetical protein [Terriglobales bacterium]
MRVAEAISQGIGAAWRTKWLAMIFLACQLVLAAAVAAPMYSAIADHVGKSAVGNELAHGFSSAWLLELQIAYSGFLKGFSTAIVYAGVLFLLLNTVLSAGAFEVFTRGAGAGLHAFGRGVGKYFLRFFRLMVIASALYFVCFLVLQDLGDKGLRWLFSKSVYGGPLFYLQWLRWALLAFLVFVISMIMEYAKADLVRDDHASVLAALGHAAGFVFSHFGRTLAIYLGLGALGALTILVYGAFARFFPQGSALTVFVWFLVAQALMYARWIFRLASWAAEISFYRVHAHTQPAQEASLADLPA